MTARYPSVALAPPQRARQPPQAMRVYLPRVRVRVRVGVRVRARVRVRVGVRVGVGVRVRVRVRVRVKVSSTFRTLRRLARERRCGRGLADLFTQSSEFI